MAAVDLAAKTAPKTVELAPAVMRYGVQRPAVLGLRWRQVASAAEKRAAEAASAMAEAEVVMVVPVVVVAAVRRSLQSGLVRPAAPHPRHGANDFGERADPAASAKSHFEITFYFSGWRPT